VLKLSPTRTIIRGDSDKFQITFAKKVSSESQKSYNPSASYSKAQSFPIDITGWDIKFTVRKDVPENSTENDNDALIAETATIVDAEKGVAVIYVQSESTRALLPGEYLYDVQIIKPVDEFGHREVLSIRRGKYVVIGDITRRENVQNTTNNTPDDGADDGYTI
jgi:hypothetical protein